MTGRLDKRLWRSLAPFGIFPCKPGVPARSGAIQSAPLRARTDMNVLAVPDLHCPYEHPQALRFLKGLKKKYKPNKIVVIGDEFDAHGWSNYGKATRAFNPEIEIRKARRRIREIFDSLGGEIVICNSNHVARAAKKVEACGIPSDFLRPIAEVLEAPPEWKWADEWEFDGVVYFHGDGYTGKDSALNAALDFGQPAVMGHVHTQAGVKYAASSRKTLWGMNLGCLIDPRAPVFEYAKHHRKKELLGAGVVLDGVPHWTPLQ